ncbi:MAG: hypothetical protein IID45_13945, partial [Planctomycetes bacterium]|nr:hypothetical protein [Planctomycetota bacterium]
MLNEDEDGYSNITDVNNVVSYISFLAELQEPSSMTFHHLAELSDIKWSFWINRFAELLAVEPVKFNTEPEYPSNIGEELRNLFHSHRTGAGLLQWLRGRRFIGSYLRSIFARLPDFV